jgi:hypothetical protein
MTSAKRKQTTPGRTKDTLDHRNGGAKGFQDTLSGDVKTYVRSKSLVDKTRTDLPRQTISLNLGMTFEAEALTQTKT